MLFKVLCKAMFYLRRDDASVDRKFVNETLKLQCQCQWPGEGLRVSEGQKSILGGLDSDVRTSGRRMSENKHAITRHLVWLCKSSFRVEIL